MISGLAAFQDNYIWIIRAGNRRSVAVVDPGDAAPVIAHLKRDGLSLAAILITHHHADHTGGIEALVDYAFGQDPQAHVPVFGPAQETIPGVTVRVREGDDVAIDALNCQFHVIEVPGHTAGHVAYVGSVEDSGPVVFCGDTLFAAGCGRLFEGTPEQMWASLQKLAGLPKQTAVYCTHEYTVSNLRFAVHALPQNANIRARLAHTTQLRAQGQSTLPSSIGEEIQTNPFLLCTDAQGFAALRREKDSFRG